MTMVILRELGRACLEDGTEVRTFRSSDGRLKALVCGGRVKLERDYGKTGTGVWLSMDALDQVPVILQAWSQRRQSWDAVHFHTAAGSDRAELLGVAGDPHVAGMLGREVRGDPEAPFSLGDWKETARVVRTDSSLVEGAVEVGAVYELPALGLRAELRRHELTLKANGQVTLEPGEERFIAALRRVCSPHQPV